ncbi:MAG: hypothetical protein ACK52S_06695, partial [Pirellula sp.]
FIHFCFSFCVNFFIIIQYTHKNIGISSKWQGATAGSKRPYRPLSTHQPISQFPVSFWEKPVVGRCWTPELATWQRFELPLHQ